MLSFHRTIQPGDPHTTTPAFRYRAQPAKAAFGAELCDLYAKGAQIVRAADCNPFVKKALRRTGEPQRVKKSLAEFAARRRQRDSDHFLSGRTPGWSLLPLRGNSPPVPDRKYLSGCKCAICTPRAYKSCVRQTAILLSTKGKALFGQSPALRRTGEPFREGKYYIRGSMPRTG